MAMLINFCIAAIFILLVLWLVNIVLKRLELPPDIDKIIHVIIAIIVIGVMLSWVFGVIPGARPVILMH